jgi:transcriptional regulator with XRE-family HTH domain
MTQADLAERVHVSVFVIGKIERGKKIPAPQLLEEIALQFGVTISELKAELERERIT